MQPHTRVLDQIITSSKGDLRDGKVLDWAPSTRSKLLSVNVGCKFRSKLFFELSFLHSLSLSLSFLHVSPHTPPPRWGDGDPSDELAKGKTFSRKSLDYTASAQWRSSVAES